MRFHHRGHARLAGDFKGELSLSCPSMNEGLCELWLILLLFRSDTLFANGCLRSFGSYSFMLLCVISMSGIHIVCTVRVYVDLRGNDARTQDLVSIRTQDLRVTLVF